MRKSVTLAALVIALLTPAAVHAHGEIINGYKGVDQYGFRKKTPIRGAQFGRLHKSRPPPV